ncbi:MAG: PLP-dependent aminotransferase family protein [Vicinamibacterales bacterium]
MPAPIALDRRRRRTLHRQLYQQLREAILSSRLRPGDRLPSTRELAAALRVARTTVTGAYDQLIAEGYLEARLGAGTFVGRELPERAPRSARARRTATPTPAIRVSSFAARLPPLASRRLPQPGVIDLSAAASDLTLFPTAVWSRLVRRALRRRGAPADPPSVAGDTRLREAIAAYLGRSRAVRCTPDQVLVTSGSQQALDLCARVLVDRGDHVAVEEPGYPEGRHLFAAAGAVVHPVPVDGDGLVVTRIPPSARLVFVTPSHQYPSGVALSLARRLELLAWVRTTGGVIVEDDYDSEFRYRGAPLPALQGLGEALPVVYVGTFSTATFAGLRLGYLVLPAALVEPFARAKRHASGPTASLEQAVLAEFIREGHFERHLRRMRRVHARRHGALLEALAQHLGARASVVGDAAGLHAVVRIAGLDAAAVDGRGGVRVETTRACYAGDAPAGEVLVRFAALTERALREGVRRLARQ